MAYIFTFRDRFFRIFYSGFYELLVQNKIYINKYFMMHFFFVMIGSFLTPKFNEFVFCLLKSLIFLNINFLCSLNMDINMQNILQICIIL